MGGLYVKTRKGIHWNKYNYTKYKLHPLTFENTDALCILTLPGNGRDLRLGVYRYKLPDPGPGRPLGL